MERWKPVADFEDLYEISSLGRIRSKDRVVGHRWGGTATKRGKVLAPRKDKDGYLFVSLCRAGVSVQRKMHRLVAQHFVPPFSGPEVNHGDLDKANNAASNLEWSTRKGNQEHASASGCFAATRNPNRAKKLTLKRARAIRADRKAGLTFAKLAEKHGVSAPTALKIVRGDIWVE